MACLRIGSRRPIGALFLRRQQHQVRDDASSRKGRRVDLLQRLGQRYPEGVHRDDDEVYRIAADVERRVEEWGEGGDPIYEQEIGDHPSRMLRDLPRRLLLGPNLSNQVRKTDPVMPFGDEQHQRSLRLLNGPQAAHCWHKPNPSEQQRPPLINQQIQMHRRKHPLRRQPHPPRD